MSGIYIPDMEMPNRCVDCPLGIWEDREVMPYCAVTDECFCVNEFIGKRFEDCPLISVPDHGRLIDADALIKLLDKCMFPSDMVTTQAVSMARNWLIDAPTIIESEGNDDTI